MFEQDKKYKVAVIGSGISGISAAWFLSQRHEVTLFEKNAKLGGHTNSIETQVNGETTTVDTGFIVYNEPNYPLLKAMFKHLEVETHPTDMSFAVSIDQGRLEYAGNNLNTLFAQRKNLFSIRHWRMIKDILRFNKMAKVDLTLGLNPDLSLGEYLTQNNFSETMQRDYLLPMAAAIWSCPTDTMLKFPAQSFLQFFANHGLLNVNERPQWRSVKKGSHQYLNKILAFNRFQIIQQGITEVLTSSSKNSVRILSADGEFHQFDHVVFACHADQSYALLKGQDFELLKHFQYQPNQAWLHTDVEQMPRIRSAWASWNYLSGQDRQAKQAVAVTYWMNQLQPLGIQTDVFVTLNPITEPKADCVIQKIEYEHPVFDRAAMQAQTELSQIQGHKNCWFVGAYCGYGFHEDGLASSAELAKRWQINLPWEA